MFDPKSVAIPSLLCFCLSAPLWANQEAPTEPNTREATEDASERHAQTMERLVVNALPLERSALETAQPVDVLAGERLEARRGVTLGETLAKQPGVQSSYYGPGAGRPIIRGLGGNRVRVLNDSLYLGDASSSSDDHAVATDPLLIEQIEILRGPATLLFGSGAAGGVVNLIDGRIPSERANGALTGGFEVRGDTVANGASGVMTLSSGQGPWAWYLDGSWRERDDYNIPGEAELVMENDHDHDHDEGHDEEHTGRLENSFVDSQTATFGLSFIGERGFIGASVRHYGADYGIPAPHFHDDGHDDEHGDDGHDESGHDEDHSEEEVYAVVDMRQTQFDLKGELAEPLPGITSATLRLGLNDYGHVEKEIEEALVMEGTRFDVETRQARLELATVPIGGWVGAIGVQWDDERFDAIGAEAYVVPNQTKSLAVFTLQETNLGPLTVSLGGRLERTRIDAQLRLEDHHDAHDDHDNHGVAPDRDHRSFQVASTSLGGIWRFNPRWQATAHLALSERAPSASELFANGAHLATFSYEQGDANLRKETSQAWDVGLHHHSTDFDFKVNAFYKAIDDFIYWQPQAAMVDGFGLRLATQHDAKLYGAEWLAHWQYHNTPLGDFDFHLGQDWVRGELSDGTDLPRISPQRLQVGIDWHQGPWAAELSYQRMSAQDRVAPNETPTDGYALIDARLSYRIDTARLTWSVFVEGKNLGNEEARVHTSYLKNYAPLPGRNVIAGIRGEF